MADMMRWAGKPQQNPLVAPADRVAQVAQLNISPLTKEHKRIERKVRAEAKKLATQAKRKKAEALPYEQAWQSADKRMRAGIEKDASKIYGDGLLSMGPETHVINASQFTEAKMVNDLREHDLTKMCDDAWNNLGAKKQSALIAQYRTQLKAKYPKAPANEVERVAKAYARQVSDQKMYDLAVQKKMPKSDLEFLAQRIAEGNSILMLTKGFARSKAGSVGTMQAEQEATQRYEKQGGFGRTVLGFAGDVVGLAADPVTVLSMGAGGLAVKGTTALAGKVLAMNVGKAVAGASMRAGGLAVKGTNTLAGKALPKVFGKTVAGAYMRTGGLKLKSINALADKMLVGMVEGGANFGTYQSAKEALGQYQMGGHINPKTGENEGYSIEEVRKSALHGAKMGAAIGWLSPVGKTLSTRLARATKSTVGKVGVRSAEFVVTPLAEGTIFSIPEWIEGGRDKMDVWTNYVAMAFVFKGPRALKTGKAVIGDMFSYKNAQSRMERLRGFETRLRARADGGAGLTLTKDEEKELMNAGYGNLVELVKDAENTEKINAGRIIDEQGRTVRDNTSLSKHGEGYDVVKSKLQEMIEDPTISEASRSKMYYYATGRKLQMSTVMGSSMTKNPDGTFTVRSEGFNGVITSRTFKSKKQAENEVDKIDRLVELNSVEIGERYKGAEAEQRKLLDACTNVGRELQADPVMLMRAYRKAKNRNAEELSEVEHEMIERIDEALKNSTLDVETPEAIRTEIAEKHGIDVDSAISKRRIRRTAAEQKAVDEYVQRLFPEQKEAKNKTRTPQERQEELLMLVDESREQGYNTENSDKATVRHEMQQSRENLVKAMSEEIASLADNGDYQGILNIIDGGELSQEQHQVLNDYINAKARYDGMIERVHDNIDDAVKESDRQIDARTNEQSGMLHRAQMQDGRVVYITHGNVVMADDGKAVDPFRSDKSVIVVDAETGKSEFTSSSAIFKVEDPVSATEAKETAGATIEDAIATQEGDLIDGTLQFKQGDRYALLDDNGQKHTVQVVQADENIVQVILDGKQATEDGKPIVMPKELLQRWSDAETMSRVSQQAEQEQAPVEAETKEEAETEPKQAETEQTEEKPTAPQAEQQPTADVATEPQAENAIAEAEQAQPTAEVEQPTAEVEQAQSDAMPMVDDAKGKPTEEPDWGKATPQRAHEYIYNKQESELDTEEANAFVENMIAEKQNAIKKIEGKKPKIGTSIADYKRKQAEWQENLQTAQAEMDYWNSIKQIHDEALLKAKQERKQADAQAHEQALEEEKQRRTEQAQAQAEREAVGNANPTPQITKKWHEATKVEGHADEIVLPNGERVKGKYMLTESGAVSPSHDVSRDFAKTEGFPLDENGNTVNDRDYERDKDAQAVTRQIASQYDSRALQSPVVVSRDGVVLSGNGRTMAGEIASHDGTDTAYNEYLKQYASKYGFTSEQVEQMKHPRVVFEVDGEMPYTADTFAKFNAQEMKGQSKTETSVKMGKVVDNATYGRIISTISDYETLGEFYADTKAVRDIFSDLIGSGVIPQVKATEMFDGDGISVQGRELIENLLIGKAFDGNPEAVRQITEYKAMRQSIVTALAEITSNRALGADYTIADELAQAIALVYQARSGGGYKAGDAVSAYARQMNLFPFEDGETVADYTNATVLMLADMLNDNRVKQLKNVLSLYNKEAKANADGQLDVFSGGVKSKEDILKDVLQLLNITPQQQQSKLTPKTKQDNGTEAEQSKQPTTTAEQQPTEATEATRQPSQAEGTAQAGTAGKGSEASEVAKPTTDKQGNPLNADGSLKVDKIGAVEELTDGDFSAPTRNVQLPTLPNNVDKAIGANGKSVVIKKNIFEKNGKHHKDLTPEDSRNILSRVLYSPDLYGNNQKETRPYNWILVNLGEGGKHKAVILEVSNNKEHVEIVNWHYLDDSALEQKKRQAISEGGRILELKKNNSAGNTTNDLSVGKDSKAFQEKQEAGAKNANGVRHRQGGDFAPMSKEQGEALLHELEKTGLAGASVESHEDFMAGLEQRQGARFSDEKDNVLTKASDFIHNAVADVKKYAGKYFDIPLPEHVEKKVKQITKGVFNHHISSNSLVHILKNHGLKGKKITENSIPLRDEDLELIPYIMIAPDNVVPGNGSIDGRTSVRFEKRLSNGVVVVVEKEYKNSPQDMETITMWAETSSNVSDARTEVRPLNSTSKPAKTSIADARTVTISSDDVAKIRKDGELAMTKAHKNRYQVVYHGSGAEFSEFDHSHMGSGEGAQAHGWGTYVAVDPNTSRYYAETLLQEKYKENRIINQLAKQRLESDGSKEESLSYLRELLEEPWSDKKRVKKQIKIIETGKFLPQGKTHFYTVDIPDNDGSNYIEEDGNVETVFQKLEAYKEHLKKDPAVRKRGELYDEYDVLRGNLRAKKIDSLTYFEKADSLSRRIEEIEKGNEAPTDYDNVCSLLRCKDSILSGKKLYTSLGDFYIEESDKKASELLHRAGFTGIHYEGQRDGECYVIFNDKDLKITHHERFMRKGDGTIYGYFDEHGVAHFDESVMNGNTAMHEFGHPWQDWCKRTNPKLYERGVELINESPYIDEVRKEAQDPDSVYYGMSEEQMGDEAIARAIGDKGEKMLEKHGVFKFAQLRDWLNELWQALKQKFGVGLNENLEDMTLDEFTTIASRDILGGEKLHDKATGTDFTHEELSIIDTAKRDKQYLEAVQRGDMDTAKEATEQKDSSANDTARSHAFDKEVNEQFNRELAELTEENADTKIFNLGMPSSILLSAGVEDKPMKLYGNKVVKKMKKHGFALDELRNLPKAVADPIAVFDNIGRIGNRSILTELRTQKGNFLVTIDLGKGGDDVDFNIVSSVFGKDGGNIVDWIERGLATYINKEKAFRYLHHSALSAEALSSSRLSSAAKIVKAFVNPSIAGEESVLHSYTEQRDELDKRYMEAVKRGDMETAQKMLAEEAERKGYTTESDYQGTLAFNGAAPSSNAYYETKAERKEAWDNGDYEGDWSLADELVHGMEMGDLEHRISAREMRRYDDMRRESAQSIRNVRAKLQAGEKNVKIKLYRSVPVGVKEKELRNGDWVTPSKSYAEYHIGLQDWDKGRVIEQEVPIEDVWWDGNDIAEWGYDNGKEEAYKNTPNNRKTFEVTYDDNGNLIPLSKRFDEGNSDTLYRMGDDGASFEERRDKAVANKGTVLPGLTDKQVRVVTVPKHSYKGKNILRQAVEAATKRYNTAHVDEQTGKETWTPKPLHYENDDAEFDYEITEQALKDAAQHSSYSDNAGVHVAVMDKLDEVIGNSIEVEEHPDVLKKDSKRLWSNGFSDDVLIHRFMGAVEIDGKLYRVKTTMRENRSNAVSNKPYTYEVTKIEVLDETSPSTSNGSPYVSDVFVDGAKLLKGVEKSYEKGKKLLEESKKNGGARFGYIGYSMSERAHQARMEGRYPKTDFKKEYDMPQPTLDALVQAGVIDGSEWHHTSKAYNKTTFYGWNDEACIATYKAHKAEIDAWAKGIDPSTGEALPAVDDTNPYHRHDTMPQGSEGRAIEDKVSGKYYDEMEEVARKYENDDKKRHEAIAEIAKRKDEAVLEALEVVPEYRDALIESKKWNERENEIRSAISDRAQLTSDKVKEVFHRDWAERTKEITEGLKLGDSVTVLMNGDGLQGKKAKAKGFYDDGRITIIMGNHSDMTDVERTILHEAVAHKGLRELFGEKFGTFLDNVYRNAEEHIKQTIDNLVSDKGMSRHEATEEYMAGLAEDTNFEQVKHTTWWAKVKSWFADMLHKLGFENFVTAEKIGNNELRYVLWRSYENLKSGGLHGIFAKAEDIAKQQKLKVGDYAEEAVRYRDGEETGQDGEPVKPQGEAEEENFLKDYNAGDATFEEAITEGLLSVAGKHKEDIKARVQATEAIGGQLSKLNRAMRVQKKYDKATVDHIIRLARTILTNGGLDKLTHGEVKRLLSYINKSVGKEAITTQARQVLDLLTEHQLKVCRESLNQLLRIKGKKVNQQGVEVQAGLDVKGQRMLETARAGIALDIDTLEQRMAEAQEKMGSDLAVEAENASIDYEGLMIARHYHELIKDSEEEEKASVFGDSAELHFKTVDAAVKFDDWLRTGRIEKQQSADELRNDTAAKQLATNAVLDALDNAGISVEVVSDEVASEMLGRNEAKAESGNKEDLGTTDHVQFMRTGGKKKSAPETASPDNQDQPTVVSSADGAKILKILDGEIKKYENVSSYPNTFIGDVSKALGAKRQGSASEYASFETKSGKTVTIRLSNHNAKVSTFDAHHEAEGISIVVTPKENKGISNDGNAHVTEFYYNAIKLRRADGKPLVEILKSIKQALYSGAYTDNTGLAEVKEVNAPTESKGQTDSGKVYGWTVGGKIFLTKDGINPNTPIHEYTHLWAEAMRQRNAKGWQSVKDLLKQRPCLGIR